MEKAGEIRVLPEAIAVTADVDDVTVAHESVDQRSRHDLVTEDFAPVLKAFVAGEDGGGALVAPREQLNASMSMGMWVPNCLLPACVAGRGRRRSRVGA